MRQKMTQARIESVTQKAVKAALRVIDDRVAHTARLNPSQPLGDSLEEALAKVIRDALTAERVADDEVRKVL